MKNEGKKNVLPTEDIKITIRDLEPSVVSAFAIDEVKPTSGSEPIYTTLWHLTQRGFKYVNVPS
jgi:hypothetical protein